MIDGCVLVRAHLNDLYRTHQLAAVVGELVAIPVGGSDIPEVPEQFGANLVDRHDRVWGGPASCDRERYHENGHVSAQPHRTPPVAWTTAWNSTVTTPQRLVAAVEPTVKLVEG